MTPCSLISIETAPGRGARFHCQCGRTGDWRRKDYQGSAEDRARYGWKCHVSSRRAWMQKREPAAEVATLNRDPFETLCLLVKESGGVMRLHGTPIEQEDLRAAVGRHAKDRILAVAAPPLAADPAIEEHW
jgi:hypothetical protein